MKLLGRLSRVTSAGRSFIPQIDGLRFVAVMAVIAYHVSGICAFHFGVPLTDAPGIKGIVYHTFLAGAFGPQLFFAISGFVLALPFARQHLHQAPPVSLRAYFIRRLTRLEPPYIIHLIFLFLWCWLVLRRSPNYPVLHGDDWSGYVLAHLFVSLFYSNGFLFRIHPFPNVVLWSLEVEVQFYIVAPLMASVFLISHTFLRRMVLIVSIMATSVLTCLAPLDYLVGTSLAGNLHFFLIGFLLCDFYLNRKWNAANDWHYLWDFLFVFVCGFFTLTYQSHFVFTVVFPWLILICCVAAFRGVLCNRALSNPWITTIGGMCYTIYMYHMILISLSIRLTEKLQTHVFWLDLILQTVLISALVIPACALLFAFFERPFMQRDWLIKLWQRIFPPDRPPAEPGGLIGSKCPATAPENPELAA